MQREVHKGATGTRAVEHRGRKRARNSKYRISGVACGATANLRHVTRSILQLHGAGLVAFKWGRRGQASAAWALLQAEHNAQPVHPRAALEAVLQLEL